MERNQKTVIVTGASQGIGAGVVQAFLARGYDVGNLTERDEIEGAFSFRPPGLDRWRHRSN